jgi:hypothetical protein
VRPAALSADKPAALRVGSPVVLLWVLLVLDKQEVASQQMLASSARLPARCANLAALACLRISGRTW